MKQKNCYVCNKTPLEKNEVGLTRKLLGKDSKFFYCLPCLSEHLEVTEEELLTKVEDFKAQGCELFY